MVEYGTVVPKGFLPVYSVDTEKEARELLTFACQTNLRGQFIAKELVEDQTIENLFLFGDRLAKCHDLMKNSLAGESSHGRRR